MLYVKTRQGQSLTNRWTIHGVPFAKAQLLTRQLRWKGSKAGRRMVPEVDARISGP